jgi:hypothetical protein
MAPGSTGRVPEIFNTDQGCQSSGALNNLWPSVNVGAEEIFSPEPSKTENQ